MPRARKHCGYKGCTVLIPAAEGRCAEHKSRWNRVGATRTSDPRHVAWATAVRKAHPYCQLRFAGCKGMTKEADHIIPISQGGAPFDPRNGQGACTPCHLKKSSAEGHLAKNQRKSAP